MVGFLFCYFVCICFLGHFFDSSAIIKLQIALYLHISVTSYLTSHQIMWHNKRIKGYLGYKTITSQNVLSDAQVKNFFHRKVMFCF